MGAPPRYFRTRRGIHPIGSWGSSIGPRREGKDVVHPRRDLDGLQSTSVAGLHPPFTMLLGTQQHSRASEPSRHVHSNEAGLGRRLSIHSDRVQLGLDVILVPQALTTGIVEVVVMQLQGSRPAAARLTLSHLEGGGRGTNLLGPRRDYLRPTN